MVVEKRVFVLSRISDDFLVPQDMRIIPVCPSKGAEVTNGQEHRHSAVMVAQEYGSLTKGLCVLVDDLMASNNAASSIT